jgi:hypothetical protein
MSDKRTLGRRRTIRFEADIDRRLSEKAAAERTSVSRVIRDSVRAAFKKSEATPADWILSVAANPPRPASPQRLAFRRKYLERHQ